MVPLLARPTAALLAVLSLVLLALAWRSPAYPLGLAGIPGIVIALAGTNPFGEGVVVAMIFAWTLAAILLSLIRQETFPLTTLSVAAFALVVGTVVIAIVRLGSTPSIAEQYGSTKLQLFVVLNVTAFVAGLLVGRSRRHFDLYAILTLGASGLGAIVLLDRLLSGSLDENLPGRYALYAESNPIQLGRAAAEGAIIATFLLLGSRDVRLRLAALALLPAIGVSLVSSGSRGPVLGLLVGLLVFLGITLRSPTMRRGIVLLATAGIGASLLAAHLVSSETVSRAFGFLSGDRSSLDPNGRLELWSQAWEIFVRHTPLGAGTGSFEAANPLLVYPHNLFLEAAAEWGVVGLAMVAGFVGIGVVACKRALARLTEAGCEAQGALIVSLFAMALVNALVSGDFPTNDALWLTTGLAVGASARGLSAPARFLPSPTGLERARGGWSGARPST